LFVLLSSPYFLGVISPQQTWAAIGAAGALASTQQAKGLDLLGSSFSVVLFPHNSPIYSFSSGLSYMADSFFIIPPLLASADAVCYFADYTPSCTLPVVQFRVPTSRSINQSINQSILVRPEVEPLLVLLPLGHALVSEGAPQQMANLLGEGYVFVEKEYMSRRRRRCCCCCCISKGPSIRPFLLRPTTPPTHLDVVLVVRVDRPVAHRKV
jgi:hypothetical protein